jgi:uncharacterized protein YciI
MIEPTNSITDSKKSELAKVNDTYDLVNNSVAKHLAKLQQYEKTTLKDLTDKVVADTKLPYSNVMGLVSIYVHQDKSVSVERGRNGGIFMGGRKPHIDNRPRCSHCNQVVRPKSTKIVEEENDNGSD